jgi:hypothetical protein
MFYGLCKNTFVLDVFCLPLFPLLQSFAGNNIGLMSKMAWAQARAVKQNPAMPKKLDLPQCFCFCVLASAQ